MTPELHIFSWSHFHSEDGRRSIAEFFARNPDGVVRCGAKLFGRDVGGAVEKTADDVADFAATLARLTPADLADEPESQAETLAGSVSSWAREVVSACREIETRRALARHKATMAELDDKDALRDTVQQFAAVADSMTDDEREVLKEFMDEVLS